jgi:serine protease Do
MSVRSLNWLKFGGLVGLAFVLGLLFAGLLDLPKNSLAQGGAVTRYASGQTAIKPLEALPLPAARPLAELSDAFAAVAEHVRPSVVFINSKRTERVAQQPRVPRGFEPFFNFPQQRDRGPVIERGSGSGFIISEDGYILTNNHVVEGAEQVTVQLLDHRTFQARVIGTDPFTDVAVIKVDAKGLTPAALGSSSATRIGEWVLAVGNPLGDNLTFTVTSGIVSAKGRGRLQLPGSGGSQRGIQDFIQTDAAINPGNSGGPLVNVRGEVIGINSAIASETGYNMGYGFAIPIDLARQVMEQLVKNGKVERGALGVLVQDAGPTDARDVGLADIHGVVIQDFPEGSPAERAGLQIGDVIVAIDDQPVNYTAQLQQIVGFRHVGDAVKVEVARKGGVRKTYTVRTIPADVPAKRTAKADTSDDTEGTADGTVDRPSGTAVKGLGITVSTLTAEITRELQLPAGIRGLVVQSVDEEGPTAEPSQRLFGVDSGTPDIIVSVDGNPVRSETDLRNAVRQAGPGGIVSMVVYNKETIRQGGGGRRVVRVQLGQ